VCAIVFQFETGLGTFVAHVMEHLPSLDIQQHFREAVKGDSRLEDAFVSYTSRIRVCHLAELKDLTAVHLTLLHDLRDPSGRRVLWKV
jgi:hypothetical protein